MSERSSRPTPINARTLLGWAVSTYRQERSDYPRLGRIPRGRLFWRIATSVAPALRHPLFIVGAPRSGTTFLGNCIGRLPEISYHHEPPATKAAGRYVFQGLWSYARSRWFYRAVYRWLLRVELDGDRRFCDKTPTNSFLIPFLVRAFPDARFLHIIRDGRDAAASLYRQPWLRRDAALSGKREPGGYPYGPWARWWVESDRIREFESTSDAHRMIWAWRRHASAALRDGRPLGRGKYFEVRYEDLVSDPKLQSNRILDFLTITDPASRATFSEACSGASRRSVGSWKSIFTDDEVIEIHAEAGDLLRSLGYLDHG